MPSENCPAAERQSLQDKSSPRNLSSRRKVSSSPLGFLLYGRNFSLCLLKKREKKITYKNEIQNTLFLEHLYTEWWEKKIIRHPKHLWYNAWVTLSKFPSAINFQSTAAQHTCSCLNGHCSSQIEIGYFCKIKTAWHASRTSTRIQLSYLLVNNNEKENHLLLFVFAWCGLILRHTKELILDKQKVKVCF